MAVEVERLLVEAGRPAYLLDGDNLRQGFNGDLGFSPEDRAENVRRVGEVARSFADAGVVALMPVISPYLADRDRVREIHRMTRLPFAELFVEPPSRSANSATRKVSMPRRRQGRPPGSPPSMTPTKHRSSLSFG